MSLIAPRMARRQRLNVWNTVSVVGRWQEPNPDWRRPQENETQLLRYNHIHRFKTDVLTWWVKLWACGQIVAAACLIPRFFYKEPDRLLDSGFLHMTEESRAKWCTERNTVSCTNGYNPYVLSFLRRFGKWLKSCMISPMPFVAPPWWLLSSCRMIFLHVIYLIPANPVVHCLLGYFLIFYLVFKNSSLSISLIFIFLAVNSGIRFSTEGFCCALTTSLSLCCNRLK